MSDYRMSDYRMSDYRGGDFDYRYLEDPFRDDAKFDPNVRAANAGWGWIAAAVLLAIALAAAFGVGHRPGQPATSMASNAMTPAATSAMAPTSATPAPTVTTAPLLVPAPNTPAHDNGAR